MGDFQKRLKKAQADKQALEEARRLAEESRLNQIAAEAEQRQAQLERKWQEIVDTGILDQVNEYLYSPEIVDYFRVVWESLGGTQTTKRRFGRKATERVAFTSELIEYQ